MDFSEVNAYGNPVQMILGQRLVSPGEFLICNLSTSFQITTALAGVNNHVADNLIIRVSTRKNNR